MGWNIFDLPCQRVELKPLQLNKSRYWYQISLSGFSSRAQFQAPLSISHPELLCKHISMLSVLERLYGALIWMHLARRPDSARQNQSSAGSFQKGLRDNLLFLLLCYSQA